MGLLNTIDSLELDDGRRVSLEPVLFNKKRYKNTLYLTDEVWAIDRVKEIIGECECQFALQSVRLADVSDLVSVVFLYHSVIPIV